MEKLISDEMLSSLTEQLAHENYNAHLYLYIAGYLKNKGFNKIGSHFEKQYNEEKEHFFMIYNLLTDLNAPVVIPELDAISMPINSILDVAKLYLEREIATTKSLNEVKKLAIDIDNPVVEEKLREMVALQQHEYAEATDFMDKAEITGGDWKWVMVWDLGFGD